ncbi:Cytochrome P450 [Pseudocohnilembus persalinus]|uniref:Cytochrome P450 n=1 Tax=Pseudocohnilembus persalinus TaxID=266149 RepID=A0A0V0QWD8_PSEPJ|nr:Cytochrome P450 [Pseudocohnilembus persalinus]|eukprot:KRX06684.1 Cytochrome P450 [Pseudocohnilembus persalinus]
MIFAPIGEIQSTLLNDFQLHRDSAYTIKNLMRKKPDTKILLHTLSGKPLLMVLDPILMQAVWQYPENYTKLKVDFTSFHILRNGIFMADYSQWKQQRKLISHSFQYDQIQKFIPIIDIAVQRRVKKLQEFSQGKQPISIITNCQKITSEVIFECFFGFDIDKKRVNDKPVSKEVIDLVNESIYYSYTDISIQIKKFILGQNCQKYRVLDSQKEKSLLERVKRLRIAIQEVIQKRIEKYNKMEGKFENKDLLDIYIRFHFEGNCDIQEIDNHNQSFDTELNEQTKKKQQIQEEINCIYKKHHQNPEEKINLELLKLDYLQAIINEGLRIHNPNNQIMYRVALKDHLLLGKYPVKKGWIVNTCIQAPNYNPKFYHNVTEFIPERWLGHERKNIEKNIFSPFISGPRNCLGNSQQSSSQNKATKNQIYAQNQQQISKSKNKNLIIENKNNIQKYQKQSRNNIFQRSLEIEPSKNKYTDKSRQYLSVSISNNNDNIDINNNEYENFNQNNNQQFYDNQQESSRNFRNGNIFNNRHFSLSQEKQNKQIGNLFSSFVQENGCQNLNNTKDNFNNQNQIKQQQYDNQINKNNNYTKQSISVDGTQQIELNHSLEQYGKCEGKNYQNYQNFIQNGSSLYQNETVQKTLNFQSRDNNSSNDSQENLCKVNDTDSLQEKQLMDIDQIQNKINLKDPQLQNLIKQFKNQQQKILQNQNQDLNSNEQPIKTTQLVSILDNLINQNTHKFLEELNSGQVSFNNTLELANKLYSNLSENDNQTDIELNQLKNLKSGTSILQTQSSFNNIDLAQDELIVNIHSKSTDRSQLLQRNLNNKQVLLNTKQKNQSNFQNQQEILQGTNFVKKEKLRLCDNDSEIFYNDENEQNQELKQSKSQGNQKVNQQYKEMKQQKSFQGNSNIKQLLNNENSSQNKFSHQDLSRPIKNIIEGNNQNFQNNSGEKKQNYSSLKQAEIQSFQNQEDIQDLLKIEHDEESIDDLYSPLNYLNQKDEDNNFLLDTTQKIDSYLLSSNDQMTINERKLVEALRKLQFRDALYRKNLQKNVQTIQEQKQIIDKQQIKIKEQENQIQEMKNKEINVQNCQNNVEQQQKGDFNQHTYQNRLEGNNQNQSFDVSENFYLNNYSQSNTKNQLQQQNTIQNSNAKLMSILEQFYSQSNFKNTNNDNQKQQNNEVKNFTENLENFHLMSDNKNNNNNDVLQFSQTKTQQINLETIFNSTNQSLGNNMKFNKTQQNEFDKNQLQSQKINSDQNSLRKIDEQESQEIEKFSLIKSEQNQFQQNISQNQNKVENQQNQENSLKNLQNNQYNKDQQQQKAKTETLVTEENEEICHTFKQIEEESMQEKQDTQLKQQQQQNQSIKMEENVQINLFNVSDQLSQKKQKKDLQFSEQQNTFSTEQNNNFSSLKSTQRDTSDNLNTQSQKKVQLDQSLPKSSQKKVSIRQKLAEQIQQIQRNSYRKQNTSIKEIDNVQDNNDNNIQNEQLSQQQSQSQSCTQRSLQTQKSDGFSQKGYIMAYNDFQENLNSSLKKIEQKQQDVNNLQNNNDSNKQIKDSQIFENRPLQINSYIQAKENQSQKQTINEKKDQLNQNENNQIQNQKNDNVKDQIINQQQQQNFLYDKENIQPISNGYNLNQGSINVKKDLKQINQIKDEKDINFGQVQICTYNQQFDTFNASSQQNHVQQQEVIQSTKNQKYTQNSQNLDIIQQFNNIQPNNQQLKYKLDDCQNSNKQLQKQQHFLPVDQLDNQQQYYENQNQLTDNSNLNISINDSFLSKDDNNLDYTCNSNNIINNYNSNYESSANLNLNLDNSSQYLNNYQTNQSQQDSKQEDQNINQNQQNNQIITNQVSSSTLYKNYLQQLASNIASNQGQFNQRMEN